MDEKDVAGIVRPFGLIGGRYQVDAAGLTQYRVAWIVAILGVLAMIAGDSVGLTPQARAIIMIVVFVIALGLCIQVVRNGTKL